MGAVRAALQPTPRRRVLLVSHVFPPLVAGGAVRMAQFASMLPDFGWDVTVLTGRHDTADALDREGAEALGKRAHIVSSWSPGTKLVRRGQPAPRHGVAGLVRRIARTAATSVVFPDRQVFWVPGAIEAGRKVLRETPHDAILATYGPASNLLVGQALAAAFGLPLIVDFRDLWSTLPMPVFPSRLHRAAAHRLERSLVRKATRLIAVAPTMASDLATTHGIPLERAISITNGFDAADLALVKDERGSEPRPFRLVYSGSVHAYYNLDPLWQSLRALADAGEITPQTLQVEFVGNVAANDVRLHRLEDFVQIRPFVPHDQIFDAFARADALLMVETAGYYARYSYAAKVFDYLLTGKPVIALVEGGGNTDTLLRRAGVGYCVEPDDTEGMRRTLLDVMKLKGEPPKLIDLGASPLREFNRRYLVEKLAGVLDDVTAL